MQKGIRVNSEIGKLKAVIIHQPGIEVELMTPDTASKALFSDILSVDFAQKEHLQLSAFLEKITTVYELKELLLDVFQSSDSPAGLFKKIVEKEKSYSLEQLKNYSPEQLVNFLIEGKWQDDKAFTSFELPPLYNFYFMRDASMSIGSLALMGKMAKEVRNREPLIMQLIIEQHPNFESDTITLDFDNKEIMIEGGDVLVAREDVLLIGNGDRTSSEAILQLAKQLKEKTKFKHIIVQTLPKKPESFIHLDMVFTFLDENLCMLYKPLFFDSEWKKKYKTKYIDLTKTDLSLEVKPDIFSSLKDLGFTIDYISCGGENKWYQDREQWHSGANFFAFAPGKVIGYGRNTNTIKALQDYGFEVISAQDVIDGKTHPDQFTRCVVTIESAELVRGGGGGRCMTMPVWRE